MVVANYEDEPVSVTVKADNGQGFGKYRLVDGELLIDICGAIEIPARSAVIIIP